MFLVAIKMLTGWLNMLKPSSILPIGSTAFTDVSSLEKL
jgi:hypothetical protein